MSNLDEMLVLVKRMEIMTKMNFQYHQISSKQLSLLLRYFHGLWWKSGFAQLRRKWHICTELFNEIFVQYDFRILRGDAVRQTSVKLLLSLLPRNIICIPFLGKHYLLCLEKHYLLCCLLVKKKALMQLSSYNNDSDDTVKCEIVTEVPLDIATHVIHFCTKYMLIYIDVNWSVSYLSEEDAPSGCSNKIDDGCWWRPSGSFF